MNASEDTRGLSAGGLVRKLKINPIQSATRCGARTRKQTPCQSPGMKNGRCRMHGGTSPGAPMGNKNALKHGYFTHEAVAERQEVSLLIQTSRLKHEAMKRVIQASHEEG